MRLLVIFADCGRAEPAERGVSSGTGTELWHGAGDEQRDSSALRGQTRQHGYLIVLEIIIAHHIYIKSLISYIHFSWQAIGISRTFHFLRQPFGHLSWAHYLATLRILRIHCFWTGLVLFTGLQGLRISFQFNLVAKQCYTDPHCFTTRLHLTQHVALHSDWTAG